MVRKEIKEVLRDKGYKISSEERLPNNTGVQLKLEIGAIVNVFDKGTYSVQGKKSDVIKKALEDIDIEKVKCSQIKVFIVYGHDTNVRNELEAMLRRWGLDPIILDQLPSEGATLIEKLENYYKEVGFGVVLATPDDKGYRKDHPEEGSFRTRQNVVLELGMLLALLGRKKVAVLLKDQDKMERPSDIQGLIYIPFKTDLAKEAGLLLAKEMVAAGYKIDVSKV